MTDAVRRRPSKSALEAMATGAAGGALGGLTMSLVGLTWPGVVAGALNGGLCGWRQTYSWAPRGALAFGLDSTWALPVTTAGLVTHGIAAAQRGRGGYLAALSRRANRHVYAGGFRLRRGFLVTIGNTIHSAGLRTESSARRRRLVTDHEDVHVWQARWFGPLYPLLYAVWMVGGALAGGVVWATRRRGERLPKVVETCAYYLNPFEWWAYSRGGSWPPRGIVAGLGWRRPAVRPLSEKRRRPPRPAPPGLPAGRG